MWYWFGGENFKLLSLEFKKISPEVRRLESLLFSTLLPSSRNWLNRQSIVVKSSTIRFMTARTDFGSTQPSQSRVSTLFTSIFVCISDQFLGFIDRFPQFRFTIKSTHEDKTTLGKWRTPRGWQTGQWETATPASAWPATASRSVPKPAGHWWWSLVSSPIGCCWVAVESAKCETAARTSPASSLWSTGTGCGTVSRASR